MSEPFSVEALTPAQREALRDEWREWLALQPLGFSLSFEEWLDWCRTEIKAAYSFWQRNLARREKAHLN